MKSLLIFLFAFSSISCLGQLQSNCAPPTFLLNHYDTDVKNLALKRIFDLKTADTAVIDIPQAFKDTIFNGLAAIYNLGNNLGADSVFQKYCVHIFDSWKTAEQIINVIVDTSYPWTQNWVSYQILTGIPSIDNLTGQYGFSVDHVYNSAGVFVISLHTTQSINHHAFKDSLGTYPGIYGFYGASYIGDGDVILYSKDDTAQYYDFYLKWNDCPAGCTAAKIWKYKVDSNCIVTLLLSKLIAASPFPPPANCYLSVPESGQNNNDLNVFPNPADTKLNIKNLSVPSKYEIRSIEGKLLLLGVTTGEVPVSSLTSGVYYILIRHEKQPTVRMFPKQ